MIAVTGANGLLGSFIVRKLLEVNEPFVALKRANSDVSLLRDLEGKIQWRNADVIDPVSLDEAFQGVTRVIHAAAMVSFNPRLASVIFNVNVQGTCNVVNACLSNQVQRLVHISSVAALGRQKDQAQIDESNKWTDNTLNSTYAESKYLAELEIFRGQEEGLDTIILNPSVILAPADWGKSSAKLFKYVWEERSYYIDNGLNYVDARDVAEATYKLMLSGRSGERFIVNAGSISLLDFFSKTAVRFGKKSPSIKVNRFFLRLLAISETLRSRLLGGEPIITRETARLADTRFLYLNGKIKKQLDFRFQTIDETLDWCCAYYMLKHKVKK